jgi:hypothetical protein
MSSDIIFIVWVILFFASYLGLRIYQWVSVYQILKYLKKNHHERWVELTGGSYNILWRFLWLGRVAKLGQIKYFWSDTDNEFEEVLKLKQVVKKRLAIYMWLKLALIVSVT